MMFIQNILRMGLPLFFTMLITACSVPGLGTTTQQLGPISSPVAPAQSFFAQAGKPYHGVVLRGLSENTPSSQYVKDVLAPAFEQETGIRVELDISDNSHIEKIIAAGGELYDYVYVEQDAIYDYLDKALLVDLTQTLQDHPRLRSPDFNPIDFTQVVNEYKDPATGDLYGIPMEAFIKVYIYRKDLFEDPAIQAEFAAKYNYPLAPAVTFKQYRDNAAFFTHYGREHNLDLWGTTVQAGVGLASFAEFFETIAPAFGVYNWGINLDNYKATTANGGQLDSDRAKEALSFWVEMLQYSPPEAIFSSWDEVADTFAAGRAAQGWIYGENVSWMSTDSTRSKVVGQVGVAFPPTNPDIIEDAITGKGYIGYYDGAAFGIPIDSKNKEATLLWLQYLGQPAIQPEWAVASSRIVHLSTFDDPLVQAQDEKLDGYYTLMKEQGQFFAGAPPFPFYVSIRNVIMPFIHQAITGELTPEQALDRAAAAVDAQLVEMGYGQ